VWGGLIEKNKANSVQFACWNCNYLNSKFCLNLETKNIIFKLTENKKVISKGTQAVRITSQLAGKLLCVIITAEMCNYGLNSCT
jgi:hypothetical protein